MTFESFSNIISEQRTAGHTRFVFQVTRRLSADLLTPVSAYLKLRNKAHFSFLLESVEGGEKMARYSFLGSHPYRIVEAKGRRVVVSEPRSGTQHVIEEQGKDIFSVMQTLLDEYQEIKSPEIPRFAGGAVGFMGYDIVQLIERLPEPPPDALHLPDAVWCFYDTVVAFDHVKHQVVLMASVFIDPECEEAGLYEHAQDRLNGLEQALSQSELTLPDKIRLGQEDLKSNMSRNEFEKAVEQAKQYIYEGDIFQVVLSQRFSIPFTGDSFNLYRALRQVNPSPYLFYLDFIDYELVGSSPEVLVRLEGDIAEVLPIAGTRPRGATPAEDKALEEDLLADPKERAEHLMLVDLGRNDLGRVCSFESVTVDRYAYIERYSHVMHIVSSVSGSLKAEHDPVDLLAACFPAGTVSGAPKVRAMEIIAELEANKRGIYAGAVGYFDYSGNFDTCIAIRTMIVRDQVINIQAGAGIVADSDPGKEYEETENKARALNRALHMAAADLL